MAKTSAVRLGECLGLLAGFLRQRLGKIKLDAIKIISYRTVTLVPVRMSMCRNIRNLFNFDPPVTSEEVRSASLQFVRKISGFSKPSKANEEAFATAVEEIAAVSARLLRSLETTAAPKNREEEAAKAKARSAQRFPA
jgi:hypothetical protein